MRSVDWFCVVKWLVVALLFSFLHPVYAANPPMLAAPVNLAWNASPDSSVIGYAIYYGVASSPATQRIDAGPALTVTISNLQAEVLYRIVAVSYNAAGVESVPSNQLLVTLPAPRLRIVKRPDGSMQLTGKAAAGTICRILYAPSLQSVQWQTLQTVTADQAGNVIATDFSARGVPGRFYRLVPAGS